MQQDCWVDKLGAHTQRFFLWCVPVQDGARLVILVVTSYERVVCVVISLPPLAHAHE